MTSNPGAPLRTVADVFVCADTGPEAITGSTRLKAGTAQKMLLNGFSTALMVRRGRTYSNLMVHVAPVNAKLRPGRAPPRAGHGVPAAQCAAALDDAARGAPGRARRLLSGVDSTMSRTELARAGGVVRTAVGSSTHPSPGS